MTAPLNEALVVLERWGLLLQRDAALPDVTTLVAGEPIRGSWWGHPKGRAIFAVLEALEESARATVVKLVNGKQTFVGRRLWPALHRVGRCAEAWQTDGLSQAALELVARVAERGSLRLDRLPVAGKPERKTLQGAARELQERLAVHARSVHTESGSHSLELTSWEAWAGQVALAGRQPGVAAAKRSFEAVADEWRQVFGGRVLLPWGTS